MDSGKKKMVAAAVALVLAAMAYWFGPDMIKSVKDSMSDKPVAEEPASQPAEK